MALTGEVREDGSYVKEQDTDATFYDNKRLIEIQKDTIKTLHKTSKIQSRLIKWIQKRLKVILK